MLGLLGHLIMHKVAKSGHFSQETSQTKLQKNLNMPELLLYEPSSRLESSNLQQAARELALSILGPHDRKILIGKKLICIPYRFDMYLGNFSDVTSVQNICPDT